MGAFSGMSTVLKKGATPIAGIYEAGLGGVTRNLFDATTFDSADGWKEFAAGLKDGGTVTFSLLFLKATYSMMKADFLNSTALAYSITLPDSDVTVVSFNALVQEFPLNIPLDDKVTISVTMKITGGITIA